LLKGKFKVSWFINKLSHSDTLTHRKMSFESPFWLRKSQQVPIIIEIKNYHHCYDFIKKVMHFKPCILYTAWLAFKKSLLLNQKLHRIGLVLKLHSLSICSNYYHSFWSGIIVLLKILRYNAGNSIFIFATVRSGFCCFTLLSHIHACPLARGYDRWKSKLMTSRNEIRTRLFLPWCSILISMLFFSFVVVLCDDFAFGRKIYLFTIVR